MEARRDLASQANSQKGVTDRHRHRVHALVPDRDLHVVGRGRVPFLGLGIRLVLDHVRAHEGSLKETPVVVAFWPFLVLPRGAVGHMNLSMDRRKGWEQAEKDQRRSPNRCMTTLENGHMWMMFLRMDRRSCLGPS